MNPGPQRPPPVQIGEVVEKYRVERIVGTGAFGYVVAARHTTLEQVVAIKFLVDPRFGSAEESLARFLAEAKVAARIESDYVCRVFDVGMLPRGVPYMIMEHLEGDDLEAEIEQRGQLGIVEAVDFVLQAADAMSAAHALGVVHRDLKPANVFLARRPDGSRRVKVLDFGIARAGGPKFTQVSHSLGTPAYMAPEQIKDPRGIDHRVDVWALGVILYEALTGQNAFLGKDMKDLLDRVIVGDPCPIPVLRSDVPPDLVAAVSRALTKERDGRFQTAATFARAIAPFGSVGVLTQLASIQREVGSLAAVPVAAAPSLAGSGVFAPPHSVPGMAIAAPHSVPGMAIAAPSSGPGMASAPPHAGPGMAMAPRASAPSIPALPPSQRFSPPPHPASVPQPPPPSVPGMLPAIVAPAIPHPRGNALTGPFMSPVASPVIAEAPPDAYEMSRRYYIAQDWAEDQTRKRQNRIAAVIGVGAAALITIVALVGYRIVQGHRGGEPAPGSVQDASSSVQSAPSAAPARAR